MSSLYRVYRFQRRIFAHNSPCDSILVASRSPRSHMYSASETRSTSCVQPFKKRATAPAELPTRILRGGSLVQMSAREDRSRRIHPFPPYSSRRFLVGRIPTDGERFRIHPKTDILDLGARARACVYACVRVYISPGRIYKWNCSLGQFPRCDSGECTRRARARTWRIYIHVYARGYINRGIRMRAE